MPAYVVPAAEITTLWVLAGITLALSPLTYLFFRRGAIFPISGEHVPLPLGALILDCAQVA
jgi:hypothetical protein